jgi:hypothetical protein
MIRLSLGDIRSACKDEKWIQFSNSFEHATTAEKLERLSVYLEDVGPAHIKENMDKYIQAQEYLDRLARFMKIKQTNHRLPVRDQIKEASNMEWIKSSLSHANGNCVEVMSLPSGEVAVRNSRNPEVPPLVFTADEWKAFISGAKNGEFDEYGN